MNEVPSCAAGSPPAVRAMVNAWRRSRAQSSAAGSGVLDQGALAAKAELSEDIEQGKVVPPGIAETDA